VAVVVGQVLRRVLPFVVAIVVVVVAATYHRVAMVVVREKVMIHTQFLVLILDPGWT